MNATGRCAGLLEMFHNGKWRRVSLLYNKKQLSYRDKVLGGASLVCKQLHCGSAVADTRVLETPEDADSVDIYCTGSESALQECDVRYNDFGAHFGVVCSGISGNQCKIFYTQATGLRLMH